MKNIIILAISILIAVYNIVSLYMDDRRQKSNRLMIGPVIKLNYHDNEGNRIMLELQDRLELSRKRNIEKLESMRDSKGTKLKLGIMGGTFNPIHNAHLATAEFIRDKYDLDKVIFIPAGDPPHKKGVLNKFKRFDMVILSTLKNDDFLVSDYEVLSDKERDYTVDTLRHISETYPNEELYFITGSDALNQMETWKEFQENFKLAKFVAAIRPGINLLETQENVEAFRQRYDADIDMVYVPSLEISSTYIRSLVKNGRSIKYLVPSRVEEYINVHNLYGGVVR